MDFPHVVVARLYEHIEPIDRGDRYEDPLQAVLDQSNAGRVTGGGSQLNADYPWSSCLPRDSNVFDVSGYFCSYLAVTNTAALANSLYLFSCRDKSYLAPLAR